MNILGIMLALNSGGIPAYWLLPPRLSARRITFNRNHDNERVDSSYILRAELKGNARQLDGWSRHGECFYMDVSRAEPGAGAERCLVTRGRRGVQLSIARYLRAILRCTTSLIRGTLIWELCDIVCAVETSSQDFNVGMQS